MLSRSRSRYWGASRLAKASTICWDVQAAQGYSVTWKCSTSRRRCSNTRNTNNTFIVIVGSEEVDGNHLTQVIVQEGLPGLTGSSRQLPEQPGDGPFRDLDAEHLQLAVNSRG